MGFFDDVAADLTVLAGVGGETTELVSLLNADDTRQDDVPASVARGQAGMGAINARNIGLFDRERDHQTEGRVLVCSILESLLTQFGGERPATGWGLVLADGTAWDFGRIESADGGLLTITWTQRDAVAMGPSQGKDARKI